MIYTVTLNPSIDYIVGVDQVKLGSLNRMNRELKLPGGKGINVSRVLNQLKAGNTALGFLGGFTGEYVKSCLAKEHLKLDFVNITGDTRINIKLKSDSETEINGPGPDISTDEADRLVQKLSGLGNKDIVILSGSIPPSLGRNFYECLIAECNRQGAAFVMDTTGEALLEAVQYRPLLVKPNHHELGELFGVELQTDPAEVALYGKKLLDLGAENVLVSMAGDGALLITKDETLFASAPVGKVKNSVGAGDSMIAGFVGTLAKGGSIREAFRTGVAAGSATAFSDDLATKEKIEQLLTQVQISELPQ